MFRSPDSGVFNADTFNVAFDNEHFFIAIIPDDAQISNAFKLSLDAFNTNYYSTRQFQINSNIFKDGKQLVILKSFLTAQEVIGYLDNFNSDKEIFKGEVKKEMVDVFPILATNLPFLYKKKNIDAYRLFYTDNYKKFVNSGQKQ